MSDGERFRSSVNWELGAEARKAAERQAEYARAQAEYEEEHREEREAREVKRVESEKWYELLDKSDYYTLANDLRNLPANTVNMLIEERIPENVSAEEKHESENRKFWQRAVRYPLWAEVEFETETYSKSVYHADSPADFPTGETIIRGWGLTDDSRHWMISGYRSRPMMVETDSFLNPGLALLSPLETVPRKIGAHVLTAYERDDQSIVDRFFEEEYKSVESHYLNLVLSLKGMKK